MPEFDYPKNLMPRPVKTLPELFVESEEHRSGLRWRSSASSSPGISSTPLGTSTPRYSNRQSPDKYQTTSTPLLGTSIPLSRSGFSDQQSDTSDKYQTIQMDSGYGELDTSIKYCRNSSSLQDMVTSLVTTPVREIGRKWRGRPSYLDPVETSSKRGVEPHTVLVWLVIITMVTSLGFALVVTFREKSKEVVTFREKNEEVVYDNDQDNRSEEIENKKIKDGLSDYLNNRLGGKKAAIEFAADKIANDNSANVKEESDSEYDNMVRLQNNEYNSLIGVYDDLDDNIFLMQSNEDSEIVIEDEYIIQTLDERRKTLEKVKMFGPVSARSNPKPVTLKSKDNSEDFITLEVNEDNLDIPQQNIVKDESSIDLLRSSKISLKKHSRKSKNVNPLLKSMGKAMMSKPKKTNELNEVVDLSDRSIDNKIEGKEEVRNNKINKPLFKRKNSKDLEAFYNNNVPALKKTGKKKSKHQNPLLVSSERPMMSKVKKNKIPPNLENDVKVNLPSDDYSEYPDDPKFRGTETDINQQLDITKNLEMKGEVKIKKRDIAGTGGFRNAKTGDEGFRKVKKEIEIE